MAKAILMILLLENNKIIQVSLKSNEPPRGLATPSLGTSALNTPNQDGIIDRVSDRYITVQSSSALKLKLNPESRFTYTCVRDCVCVHEEEIFSNIMLNLHPDTPTHLACCGG